MFQRISSNNTIKFQVVLDFVKVEFKRILKIILFGTKSIFVDINNKLNDCTKIVFEEKNK